VSDASTRAPAAPPLDRSCFSLVVPVYNEEANLEALRSRVGPVLDGLGFDACEVLLVSDGSTDGSEAMIRRFCEEDARFRGVFLTRNFGHQAAVTAGLAEARGSVVAVIDADLQDPPEVLGRFVGALEAGADVAYGVRENRTEAAVLRFAYWLFYRLQARLSSIQIPLDAGDFCCMRRRVVDAMGTLPETRRFVRGLRAWVGFRQVGVSYDRAPRHAGTSKYGIRALLRLAYDGLFSFSDLPVKVLQFLGFAVSALAMLVGFGYFLAYFFFENPPGFPTLIISIWFLAGVQLLFLGVIGEYLHRTYEQSMARPSAVVRERVGGPREAEGAAAPPA
jgi:dolichol-phosphate mannosyltransferase